jgi:hypothetical protein
MSCGVLQIQLIQMRTKTVKRASSKTRVGFRPQATGIAWPYGRSEKWTAWTAGGLVAVVEVVECGRDSFDIGA